MNEETTVVGEQQKSEATLSEKMANSFFNDEPIVHQVQQQQASVQEPVVVDEPIKKEPEEEIFNADDWLEKEFGTRDISSLKQEREELLQLREKIKSSEINDEESKKAYEYLVEGKMDDLYGFLSNKMQVKKLASADLSDYKLASELVKFNIKRENPNLNEDEVEFLFNNKYSIPVKPTQSDTELEDEYSLRLSSWEQQKSAIEKQLVIDAKMAQPKLAQYNNELNLPKIERQPNQVEPTPEELEKHNKIKESFLQSSKQFNDNFSGFSAMVKDKDVEVTGSYAASQEEKAKISEMLNDFAKHNFDVNAIFAERWYDLENNTFKVEQMVEDLHRIFAGKNVDQKLVADAANKRMEAHLKEKKNVVISEPTPSTAFSQPDMKEKSEKMAAAFFV